MLADAGVMPTGGTEHPNAEQENVLDIQTGWSILLNHKETK